MQALCHCARAERFRRPRPSSLDQFFCLSTGDNAEKRLLKSTGVGTDSTAFEASGSSSCNDQVKDGSQTAGSHRLEDASIPNGENEVENAAEESVEVAPAGHYVPLSPHIAKPRETPGIPGRENGLKSPKFNIPTSINRSVHEGSHTSGSSDTSVDVLDSSRSLDLSQRFRNNNHHNVQSESRECLIDSSSSSSTSHSKTHLHPYSSHNHTHSSFTDADNTSLSQLSAGAAENRSSAESTQLGHLFKVHSLQEELSDLTSKLNDRGVPLDVIVDDFRQILQEHQQLARDIDTSSAHLNVVRSKCSGNSASRVDKTGRAIENEVQFK